MHVTFDLRKPRQLATTAVVILIPLQYLHPLEAEGYRETVRAIRAIGRDCIQKRIRTIKSGEQPPNDILSHILQVVSK